MHASSMPAANSLPPSGSVSIVAPVANRLKALLMLAVVGLVLPLAGAPQRFCVKAFTLMAPGQDCSACQGDACGCHLPVENPQLPGCIVGAKLLPDGVSPDGVSVPPVLATVLVAPESPTAGEIASVTGCRAPAAERGPPPGTPLYLLKRSLLL